MFKIKYHDNKTRIVSKEIDAEKIEYTHDLVKFYKKGALIDFVTVGDLDSIEEEKPKARYV